MARDTSGQLFQTGDLAKLVGELTLVTPAVLVAARAATQTAALALKAGWQSNAQATAGRFGGEYSAAITYETRILSSSVQAEVGPVKGAPGTPGSKGRGFEYGSVNQPPHLDGTKALEVVEPTFIVAMEKAVLEAMNVL